MRAKKAWIAWTTALLSAAAVSVLIVVPIAESNTHPAPVAQPLLPGKNGIQVDSVISQNLPAVKKVPLGCTGVLLQVKLGKFSNNLSFQWYVNTTSQFTGAKPLAGQTRMVYAVPTDHVGTRYYYLEIRDGSTTIRSSITAFTVEPPRWEEPSLSSQTYRQGVSAQPFHAPKCMDPYLNLHYQWQVLDAGSWVALPGQTGATYLPLTTNVGHFQYRCQITWTLGGQSFSRVGGGSFSLTVNHSPHAVLAWTARPMPSYKIVYGQEFPSFTATTELVGGTISTPQEVLATYNWVATGFGGKFIARDQLSSKNGITINDLGSRIATFMARNHVGHGKVTLTIWAAADGKKQKCQTTIEIKPFAFQLTTPNQDLSTAVSYPQPGGTGENSVTAVVNVANPSFTPVVGKISYHYQWSFVGKDGVAVPLASTTGTCVYQIPSTMPPGTAHLICHVNAILTNGGTTISLTPNGGAELSFTLQVHPAVVNVGNSIYNYETIGGKAYIVGMNEESSSLSTVIPEVVDANGTLFPVVGIGLPGTEGTFKGDSFSWNLTIPPTINFIAPDAFAQARFLGDVTFMRNPALQAYFSTFGDVGAGPFEGAAFTKNLVWENGWTTINASLFSAQGGNFSQYFYPWNYATFEGNVVIPDTVTTIASYAFNTCTFFKSLILPASVNKIGSWAFWDTRFEQNVGMASPSITVGQGIMDGTICHGFVYVPKGYNYESIFSDVSFNVHQVRTVAPDAVVADTKIINPLDVF